MRTHGVPRVSDRREGDDVVLDDHVGLELAEDLAQPIVGVARAVAERRKVGSMNSASCSIVGLRKTGAVSRMKSFQNCPGASATSGGGPSRMRRSSNPCASRRAGERLLDHEDDAVAATRAAPAPIPTQLFVGP